MGIVNKYIKKILKKIKPFEDKEKPWLKFYDDIPENLTYSKGSIYDHLVDTASKNENRIATRFFGRELTFRKFLRKVDKIASALKQFDIVENECVTMCLPNSPESFALIYAINKVGGIANIVHPLSTKQEIERALSETNSSILICSDVSMPQARDIKVEHFVMLPTSTSLTGILKLGYNIKNASNMRLDPGMLSWEEFIQYTADENPYCKRKAEDPAAIIYSGGTTGKPKGIIISNLNFNAMAAQTAAVCKHIRAGNSVLSALPIFHVFGLSVCVHSCLMAGMTLIIVPKINTRALNKELKKYKPNVFPAVPSMLKLAIHDKDPGKRAFKDIKIVVVGGDYLPPNVREEMLQHLRDHGSNADIKIGYGLSEATGFATSTAFIDEDIDSLGVPNPDMMVKVFEPNSDIEKVVGEIGEICISGPTIMMGYINEDEETKKTLVTHHDGKIWLHTGDLGYQTKDGVFHYTSRLKRMIITNGYNVYPVELEDIISKCELVKSVTVVGIPHKIKSQTPKAVIVLKDGVDDNPITRMKIKKYCSQNIAKYAVPTEYEYRKDLPVTAVGKVAYKLLEKKEKEDDE